VNPCERRWIGARFGRRELNIRADVRSCLERGGVARSALDDDRSRPEASVARSASSSAALTAASRPVLGGQRVMDEREIVIRDIRGGAVFLPAARRARGRRTTRWIRLVKSPQARFQLLRRVCRRIREAVGESRTTRRRHPIARRPAMMRRSYPSAPGHASRDRPAPRRTNPNRRSRKRILLWEFRSSAILR